MALRHEPYLRRRALQLTGSRADADDLVQDTLNRALVHFKDFRQGSDGRAWMVTILARLYLDRIKHTKVIDGAEAELITLNPVEWNMELVGISDAQLWAAVGELDPGLREVVELRFHHGLKCREIGERLGLPTGTIGRRLSDAYERLRRRLTTR